MPLIAGSLNFAWEINALLLSRGFYGHVLWTGLDVLIVFHNVRFLEKGKRKKYLLSIVVFILVLYGMFRIPNVDGQRISVFAIDLIMAIEYTFIFVKNGLIAARRDVDNGQTPMSESEIPVSVYGLIIRSPMFNRGQHLRHELSVICIPFEYSGYSTHIVRVCLYKSIIFSRFYYKRFSFFNAVNLWRYIFKILEIRS